MENFDVESEKPEGGSVFLNGDRLYYAHMED